MEVSNSNTIASPPMFSTIVELFVQQAKKHPSQQAIVFNNQAMDYQTLDRTSNQLAHYLINKFSIQLEDLVGVQIDRSEWLIIAQLAILKTGAAFVAIDPAYPEARIKEIKTNSSCHITVEEGLIKDFLKVQSAQPTALPQINIQAHNLAYVIYTSGSTGTPKGVMIEHRSLINLCYWHCETFQVNTLSRGTLFAGVGFDVSIWEIYPYLLSGASLYPIADRAIRYDLDRLCAFLEGNEISHAFIPTQICQELVNCEYSLNDIMILTAGELLKLSKANNLNIYNNYGPTEYTVITSFYKVGKEMTGPIPIGKPISNTEMLILSEELSLKGTNEVGELCIAGIGLARGYLNREKLTQEKFVAHPFVDGERMYKTGDLAKYLPDGNIEFVGRIDDQVKIRGYRIELGEIEYFLAQYKKVRNSLVMAKEKDGDKYLVAYYASAETINPEILVDHLAANLPEYMVPTYFVHLKNLPLNANGKIDKAALPEPHLDQEGNYVAPSTFVEKQLQKIWAEILKLDKSKISITNSFFSMGGHSLKALRLINKIARQLKVSIGIEAVFSCKNIQNLATLIENSKSVDYQAIHAAKDADFFPLSFAQQRMYVLHQLDKDSLTYNVPNVLRIKGALDKERLENCFQQLVARHESLRTSFENHATGPMQKIAKSCDFTLEEYNSEEEKVNSLIRQLIQPFDLAKAPLQKIALICLAEEDHLLFMDFHHIIIDGVSYETLMEELGALYSSVRLPKLSLQYKDYAVWQQSVAYLEKQEKSKQFWLDEFSAPTEILELPEDFQRPSIRKGAGDTLYFDLPSAQSKALEKFAEEEGLSMYMLLLSLFTILLSRLGNQEEVVIGTPVSGREHDDLEGLIGVFVNTLAIKNQVQKDLDFRSYLAQVKSKTIDCFKHQNFQYDELVKALDWKRDLRHNPLFDVLFAYEKFEDSLPSIPGMAISTFEQESYSAQFDLSFTAQKLASGFRFSLNYATDLFKSSTIERFATCFKNIINQVVENKEIKIEDLNLLSVAEQKQLLKKFNTPQKDFPAVASILDLFDASVEKTPDNIAVRFGEEKWTYRELQIQANKVAAYLIKKEGLTKGDFVGILLDREAFLLPLIFGILKAGMVYIPIDVKNPVERINTIIEDSGLKNLVSRSQYKSADLNTTCRLIDLDQVLSEINEIELLESPIAIEPTDLAYIIFTSGSTGKPNGVLIEPRSLSNLIQGMDARYPLKASSSFLFKTTYSFDVSVAELFGWFLNGGSLSILAAGAEGDPSAIRNAIAKYQVTHINFVPSLFAVFMETLTNEELDKIKSLSYLFLAGEELPLELAQRFNALNSGVRLENIYGPTEATIYSSAYSTSQLEEATKVPIGQELPNVSFYILSPNNQLLPIEVPGELCIGGSGLARGYLNKDKITQEKFIPHPFIAGERLYRTGDLARRLADGNIEYLGRIDNQVKVRGYRIELGEIENNLTTFPAIKTAVALVKESKGDKMLVAYYLSEMELEPLQLKTHLAKTLPEYMIPSFFIRLDEMPLSSSGKLNRKALPEFEIIAGENFKAATSPTEKKLVAIWSEVLKIKKELISVDKSFFDLGGHSLKATTLVNKIFKELGVDLPLNTIFIHQDIERLSRSILKMTKSSYMSISVAPEKEYYKMSSAQKRMYFLYVFDKNSLAYNMPQLDWLEGDLDQEQLVNAFNKLIDRHEILRTTFHLIDNEPVQKINSKIPFKLETYRSRDADLDALVQDFTRPFDLQEGPLIRVGLVEISAKEKRLLVDMHHIVTDGISYGIMLADFYALYRGETLPTLTLQYKDYAEWQQSTIRQEELSLQKTFWLGEFAEEWEALSLPNDFARPLVRSYAGDSLVFTIKEKQASQLRDLARKEGLTPFMLFLALFKILLSKLSGQEDVIIGTPVAGRQHADLENMLGLFVNTLALRNQVNGKDTFLQFLSNLKTRTLSCIGNQSYPYEELIDGLQLERDTGRNPLFDVMFAYNNFLETEGNAPAIVLEGQDNGFSVSKFDLTLSVSETVDEFALDFEYSTDLFTRATIERFTQYFQNLITAVLARPAAKIMTLEIIGSTEKQQLIEGFNTTQADFPREKTVLQLFEEQAQKKPNNKALLEENNSLTYRELDQRANQVAHYLRNRGVEQGDTIGFQVTKSAEMIVHLLGIWKAGCSYVPIDENQPVERSLNMLEETQAKLLLTDKNGLLRFGDHLSVIDIQDKEIGKSAMDKLSGAPNASSDAYIIYTSGSTGKPKGVRVQHRSVTNLICAQTNTFGITEDERILQFSAVVFDASVEQIWIALTKGAALVMIPKMALLDNNLLNEYLLRFKVSHLDFTPSFLESIDLKNQESIRRVVLGGEACKVSTVKKYQKQFKIFNAYGPTEATVTSIMREVTAQDLELGKIPIGRPIANTVTYILDSNNDLCPIGVKGELLIGGECLAKGYLNDEGKTKNKFIPDPFRAGERLYKTGDMAKWLPDGSIEFLGRKDNQVKIRGFRIELEEIENCLLTQEQINEVTVLARNFQEDKRLVAYYVAEEEIESISLSRFLADKLPDYMIPSFFVHLKAYPLTVNGKLNYRLLPIPKILRQNDYVGPTTTMEEKLLSIWSEVLKIEADKISVTSSFFDIGGHSLKAIAVIGSVFEQLNINIKVADFFKMKSIQKLAHHLDTELWLMADEQEDTISEDDEEFLID